MSSSRKNKRSVTLSFVQNMTQTGSYIKRKIRDLRKIHELFKLIMNGVQVKLTNKNKLRIVGTHMSP